MLLRAKWETSVMDEKAGHWKRCWVPCLVLTVDYDHAGSPSEYAMIAIKAKDDAGGMRIKKVPTHEVRLLQQEIPLV